MSRGRNIRRRSQRRTTCEVCRRNRKVTLPFVLYQGRALCTGCYWIASSTGMNVARWLGPEQRRRWDQVRQGVDKSSTGRVE